MNTTIENANISTITNTNYKNITTIDGNYPENKEKEKIKRNKIKEGSLNPLTTQNTKEINNTNQISETNKNNKMNNKEVIKINVIDDDNETGTISLADGFKKEEISDD